LDVLADSGQQDGHDDDNATTTTTTTTTTTNLNIQSQSWKKNTNQDLSNRSFDHVLIGSI